MILKKSITQYNKKIRIAISGAGGRMGRKLIQTALKTKHLVLSVALENKNSSLLGSDVGELVNAGKTGVIIQSSLKLIKNSFDVFIDFTYPKATLNYLRFCHQNHKPMIIGTTGFNNKEKKEIHKVTNDIAIVLSSNFSIGMNTVLILIEQVTGIIGHNTDIDIIEAHHRYKVDSPSGTALEMKKVITNTLDKYSKNRQKHFTETNHRKQVDERVNFSIIRAGDIIGEHTVMFSNIGERVEITHKTSNRIVFAYGALKAATWITKRKNGFFSMKDVLKLHK